VAKVNPAGTGLVYSGYIGGSDGDKGWDIAVDGSGNAYVTGGTWSSEATFPVNVGPDLTFNGGYDAFVAKVNPSGAGLVYAGYIGGSGHDASYGIAVDGSGNAYVTGATSSDETTFPVIGGPDLIYNGGYYDAFVAKVNPSGAGLVYGGYIGGYGVGIPDVGWGIAVDGSGNAYVTGYTASNEDSFPVTTGPDLTHNGYTDAFVAKVKPDGAGLVYAGYIGGSSNDYGRGIAVDVSGNAYVAGGTKSSEATFPVTTGPDLTHNGGKDAFVAKVRSMLVPPANPEIIGPDSGMIDTTYHFTATTSPITTTIPLTYVWQATGKPPLTHTSGLTDTASFNWDVSGPKHITVTARNATNAVTNTHLITLYTPVQTGLTANPTEGIAPLTVAFTNTSTGDFETSVWDFGDSITSTVDNPTHTYGTSGVYTVTLVVDGLGGTDTATLSGGITVYESVQAGFSARPTEGIAPLTVAFTNTSTGDFQTSFWYFGDGITSTVNNPTHIYSTAGVYTVTLTASGLGGQDTATRTNYITVYEPVQAEFTASPTHGQAPLSVRFANFSVGDFDACLWDFGDGGTSDVCFEIEHEYIVAGSFTVTLTVNGPGGTDIRTRVNYIEVDPYETFLPLLISPY